MIVLAAAVPVGLVYVHGLPAVPPVGNVNPKQALILAAVPASSSATETPKFVTKLVMIGSEVAGVVIVESRSCPTSGWLGPLYVIQANRLSGKRVLTRGSPTLAVVPLNRVKLVVTWARRKFGLVVVGVAGENE